MIPHTHPSLLIVDDEPGLRLALRANFLREGWSAEVAGGLQEAFARLSSSAFDLVLCDVRMGDGDGFALMQAVRYQRPDTSLLFLTAYGSVPEAVRAIQGGAVDYLTKPVSFDHLLRVAKRTIGPPMHALRPLTPDPVRYLPLARPLSMDQIERTHVEQTLELVGGNRTRAAEILGISVRTMRNKIKQYDLPPRRYA